MGTQQRSLSPERSFEGDSITTLYCDPLLLGLAALTLGGSSLKCNRVEGFGASIARRTDWDLIAQQYDPTVKYATVLRLGTADTLRRFHPCQRPTSCYRALRELGKPVVPRIAWSATKVSPMLSRQAGIAGLSAGGVKTVAVRFVVDRQRGIESFKITKHFGAEAIFEEGQWRAVGHCAVS